MPAKVNIQAIVTYLLISFTLAWLLTLLLTNSDWLHNPWFAPLMCLMVCSPGIAALATMGIVEKRYISHIRELRALGFLGWASPLKFVTCLVIAPVSFVVFVFGSLYLAVTFGLLDVTASALTSALKAAMASSSVQLRKVPRSSVTISECISAVPTSQGMKEAFSTGSQNHQPPQPSS